jgi:hypothetical protein
MVRSTTAQGTADMGRAVGRLDKTLDEAKARGWTVIGMKDDRRRVFPFAGPKEP